VSFRGAEWGGPGAVQRERVCSKWRHSSPRGRLIYASRAQTCGRSIFRPWQLCKCKASQETGVAQMRMRAASDLDIIASEVQTWPPPHRASATRTTGTASARWFAVRVLAAQRITRCCVTLLVDHHCCIANALYSRYAANYVSVALTESVNAGRDGTERCPLRR